MLARFGLPETLYGDRTNIAIRNDAHWDREEELAGQRRPTQFGQMLEELGVRYIAAHSPEAKGRIERHWKTFQDRLPAELSLHGIRTLEAFDAFLPSFLERCRGWFAKAPRDTTPAWRPVPRHVDRILACRYSRVVGRDNVVSIPGHTIQLPRGGSRRSFAHARVEVRELLDGRLLVLHQGAVLVEHAAPPPPFVLVPRASAVPARRPKRTPEARGHVPRPGTSLPPAHSLPAGDRQTLARLKARPTPTTFGNATPSNLNARPLRRQGGDGIILELGGQNHSGPTGAGGHGSW